ncbi:MAG: CbiX/SirB N-terminal domain-containing protein [Candidatus Omnitrophica bacterium]|nr:CbiX/SirB N-terminal domain-containing protein [Candidatus Omnitrophota bacterium]
MKSAYLIIAHGSKDEGSNEAFWKFLEDFRKQYSSRWVEGAFLEMVKPSISQGIENCIEKGALEIFVIPLMLFPGRHVKDDIPRLIQESKAKFPAIDFHYAGPLSEKTSLAEVVEQKAKAMKAKNHGSLRR